MAHSTEIMTHNLRDTLNSRVAQRSILEVGADVIIMPEAASEKHGVENATEQTFSNAGYRLYFVRYGDDDGRADRHYLAMAVKAELDDRVRVNSVRLAGRAALALTTIRGEKILGVHFDDRGETRRQAQAKDAIANVGRTALIAGDFNATDGKGLSSAILRLTEPFVRNVETDYIERPFNRTTLENIQAAGQMASGGTIRLFTENGFQDADPARIPTVRRGPIKLQLDHMQYRGDFTLQSPVTVEAVDYSNHRRILSSFLLPHRM